MSEVDFVAEVSSNHARDLDRALRFVDAAADLGCAAVKFQQFRIRELFAPEALRANPALLERVAWELPESFNHDLALRARARRIAFASTPFYLDAVRVLEPWVDFFKVASYQILWTDLLREVARTGKRVVLSTGMADGDEIARAVEVLREAGCGELWLLHCVSTYPTDPSESNLAAIATLRERFGVPVGWSDHTTSVDVVRRAVARFGARAIELHLDLDGDGAEFAGGHCWLPQGVRAAMSAIASAKLRPTRTASDDELASSPFDGDGSLAPRACEAHERRWRTDPSDGLRPLHVERLALAKSTSVG